MRRLLCLLAWAAAASGCASMSSMGTARLAEPGRTRLVPAMALSGSLTGRVKGNNFLTQIELGVAHGVHERAEVGGKAWLVPGDGLWSWGAEGNTRLGLWRSPDPNQGVDLALLVRAAYQQLGTGGTLYHTVAGDVVGLVGINLGHQHQLVFGAPILGVVTWFDDSADPIAALRVGGSLGLALYASGCFAVMPELAFTYATAQVDKGHPTALFQATVAVLVDL